MGRGRSISNVDVTGRIRQFLVLVFITVIGMVISSAFFGPSHKAKGNHSTNESGNTQPIEASFK